MVYSLSNKYAKYFVNRQIWFKLSPTT